MQRGASFRPGFGEEQRSRRELERREIDSSRGLLSRVPPLEPSRNHQVQDEVDVVLQLEEDTLPETRYPQHLLSERRRERWVDAPQEKWALQSDLVQPGADDPTRQRFDVDGYIGKFGHGSSYA